jgi:hypothetical protein
MSSNIYFWCGILSYQPSSCTKKQISSTPSETSVNTVDFKRRGRDRTAAINVHSSFRRAFCSSKDKCMGMVLRALKSFHFRKYFPNLRCKRSARRHLITTAHSWEYAHGCCCVQATHRAFSRTNHLCRGRPYTRLYLPGRLSDLFRIHNITNVSEIVARRQKRRVTSLYASLPSIPRSHVKQFWTEQQPQCCLSYKGVARHKWYKLNRLRLFQPALQPGWTRCLNIRLKSISSSVTKHPPFG